MSNTISTPNMNLTLPVPGTDPGPDYALVQNLAFSTIDLHDHSAGKGVQITPSGLNINSDLSVNANNITSIRSVRLNSQGAVLSQAADLDCLYTVGVDLYYNDGNGNNVRITQSGGVAGSPGSISNLTSPASASYVSISSKFVWQSAANTAADLDFRSAILRNSAANSKGLTLSPPSGMASDYNLVLPSIPASQSFLTIDNAGNISAYANISQGITGSNIANATITGSKIASSTIQGTNIASSTIQGTNIANATIVGANITGNTITKQNLVALGEVLSSSSGSFTRISTAFANVVTNTITTTGRPVQLVLQPDGSSTGYIIVSGSIANNYASIRILRDSNLIAQFQFGVEGASGTPAVEILPGAVSFIDTGATSASHLYELQAAVVNAGTTIVIQNCRLISYEL